MMKLSKDSSPQVTKVRINPRKEKHPNKIKKHQANTSNFQELTEIKIGLQQIKHHHAFFSKPKI